MDSIRLKDSAAWRFQVVAAFAIALAVTSIGIWYLPIDVWSRNCVMMGLYFTVSSAFGLAKSLRDNHESSTLIAKITEAKTERMLRDLAQA